MTAPRSSQMEAVMRVMAGMEERTIAEKLADPNRPTWEQYKKDNEDKLNLSGMDQKKMEEYRKELDEERDRRLARGSNHQGMMKRKSKRKHYTSDGSHDNDDDDDSSEERRKRRKAMKKHKKNKKKRSRKYDSSDSDSDSAEEESRREKKKSKKSKKSSKQRQDEKEDNRYRLSNFFTTKGSESE